MYNGAKEGAMSLDLRDETKRKRKVQGDLFGYPSPCTKELVRIIWVAVKIMLPLLGALNIRCCVITYNWDPKGDHDFDNHSYDILGDRLTQSLP